MHDGRDLGSRDIRRVLITGIAGSGGSYLAEHIVNNHPEVEVFGLARWHSTTQDHLRDMIPQVQLHEADLLDLGSVVRVLKSVQPDSIVHLAAHANVRASFDTPVAVLTNNIVGTSHLFEAVRLAELDPVILLCSTSEVYGQVDPSEVPIKETAQLRPASPYAVSKTAQDLLGWSYFVSYQLRIIRTRMFAYLNPRRTDLFATSFARQIARIEEGHQAELLHGNLESVRTLVDVRDAMQAYWDALLFCQPGEVYNIGGGAVLTVGDVLDRLIALATCPIPLRPDSRLLRPADVTLQIPNIDAFVHQTGWHPAFSVDESLLYLLDYWRHRIRLEAGLTRALEQAGR